MADITDPHVTTQARFLAAERTLVGWWELQSKANVTCDYSEWFVEVNDHRYSLSELALAIAQEMV